MFDTAAVVHGERTPMYHLAVVIHIVSLFRSTGRERARVDHHNDTKTSTMLAHVLRASRGQSVSSSVSLFYTAFETIAIQHQTQQQLDYYTYVQEIISYTSSAAAVVVP